MLLQMEHIFNEFQPHKACWLMRSDLVFSHAMGDALICFSYYLIPCLLFYATRRYKFDWSLTFIFSVYAVFIFLCGTTHLLDVVMIWKINEPIIVFDGWLRVLTGVFSLFSAGVTLWALQIFLSLANQLFEVSLRIRTEKAKFGKASMDTLQAYEEVSDRVEAYLQSKEVKQ